MQDTLFYKYIYLISHTIILMFKFAFLEKMRDSKVNSMARLETIKKRGKDPLIYHQINITCLKGKMYHY